MNKKKKMNKKKTGGKKTYIKRRGVQIYAAKVEICS